MSVNNTQYIGSILWLINTFFFLLHYLLYYYFIYFVLTVISENGQIISIITDYECVTCHRIFQSEDVSQKLIFFLNLFYTSVLFLFCCYQFAIL